MARFLGAYPNPNRHFWWFIGPCEVTFDFVRLDQIPSGNQLHGLLENPPAIIVPWFYHPENLRIFHGEFPISARHGTVTPIQGGSLTPSDPPWDCNTNPRGVTGGQCKNEKHVIEIEAFILTICESRGESTPHVSPCITGWWLTHPSEKY